MACYFQPRELERLSHHLFTLLPERLGIFRVEGISTYAFADGRDGRVVRHHLANVAVLTIARPDFVSGGDHSRPHRSRGPLGNGLPLEGPLALGGKLSIDFF